MPARSGDCTSVRKRASRSPGSAVRTEAAALARRALKVRSSIVALTLSGWGGCSDRSTARPPAAAVVVALVALDQRLHLHGVVFPVAVTENGTGAAARLDEDVREQHLGIDFHRCDMRHV